MNPRQCLRPGRARLLATLVAAVAAPNAAAVMIGPLTVAEAEARPNGRCTSADGVNVIVDFGELGADPVIGCAPHFTSGTGIQALRDAGIEVETVVGTADGFVCRLDGRPTANEDIPLSEGRSHRERCLEVAPAAAHWSYWTADGGGTWQSSPLGAANRQAVPGGFEGWSWTSGQDRPRPPAIAPERLATADRVDPSPAAEGQARPESEPEAIPRGTLLGLGALGLVAVVGLATWWRGRSTG